MTIEPRQDSADARRRMAAIHVQYSRPILSFLLKLSGGNLHHAEDLLQETMLRAWRYIDSVPTGSPECKRWLFTVARHISVDAARRSRRRPQEVELTDLTDVSTADETVGSVLAVHTVRQALQLLTPDQRVVLTELYVYGRPTHQVAERLGVPIGTVKSRAHQAVQQFRRVASDVGNDCSHDPGSAGTALAP